MLRSSLVDNSGVPQHNACCGEQKLPLVTLDRHRPLFAVDLNIEAGRSEISESPFVILRFITFQDSLQLHKMAFCNDKNGLKSLLEVKTLENLPEVDHYSVTGLQHRCARPPWKHCSVAGCVCEGRVSNETHEHNHVREMGHRECASLLLENGASVSVRNHQVSSAQGPAQPIIYVSGLGCTCRSNQLWRPCNNTVGLALCN